MTIYVTSYAKPTVTHKVIRLAVSAAKPGTHHDGGQGQHSGHGGVLSQDQLGQQHVESGLQGLDSVGQGDGHSCERDVGSNVANGVHGSRAKDLAKLLLGHNLRTTLGQKMKGAPMCVQGARCVHVCRRQD